MLDLNDMASCKIVRYDWVCWCAHAVPKHSNSVDLYCRLPRITELILTFMKPVKLMQNHIARVPKLRRDKSRHVWWVNWLRQFAVWLLYRQAHLYWYCLDIFFVPGRHFVLIYGQHCDLWTIIAYPGFSSHMDIPLFLPGPRATKRLHSPSCLISGNNYHAKYRCRSISSCIKHCTGCWLTCIEPVSCEWQSNSNSALSEFVGLLQLRQQGRLTWECQNELFRQEVEGADDIRLNALLVSKCMSDKRTFCNDVAPGMLTQIVSLLAHGALCSCIYAQNPCHFLKYIRHGSVVRWHWMQAAQAYPCCCSVYVVKLQRVSASWQTLEASTPAVFDSSCLYTFWTGQPGVYLASH